MISYGDVDRGLVGIMALIAAASLRRATIGRSTSTCRKSRTAPTLDRNGADSDNPSKSTASRRRVPRAHWSCHAGRSAWPRSFATQSSASPANAVNLESVIKYCITSRSCSSAVHLDDHRHWHAARFLLQECWARFTLRSIAPIGCLEPWFRRVAARRPGGADSTGPTDTIWPVGIANQMLAVKRLDRRDHR